MKNDSTKKPEPSKGQVWRFHDPKHGEACEMVFGLPSHGPGSARTLMGDPRWSCIGIETPAGRVMVGERRQSDCPSSPGAHVVVRVINDTFVSMRDERGDDLAFGVARVASWPLVSPPTPTAVAPKAEQNRCKCGAAMTASMVMCPGCAADALLSGEWEKDPELRARYNAAAHEEHPRPGTVAWLVKSVAYLCSIPKDDVAITEDHARALVIVRVPRRVTADTMRAAGTWLKDAAPVYLCIRLEYAPDPREQGPGIAARVPPRASVRPDVVVCAEWEERWGWA